MKIKNSCHCRVCSHANAGNPAINKELLDKQTGLVLRTATAGNDSVKGFTLIELLVVVLIIGILAAVALPQYQRAVVKSKLSALKTMVGSVSAGAEEVYLATGAYPFSVQELAVQPPTPNEVVVNDAVYFEKYMYDWGECILVNGTGGEYFVCRNPNAALGFAKRFLRSSDSPGRMSCEVLLEHGATTDAARAVCKSETGKSTPYYTDSHHESYSY